MPDCPFCTEEHEMEESRTLLGAWFCPHCSTTFKLSKDELEPVYEFRADAELSRRRTCVPLAGAGEDAGVGGLCRSCQHNQTIIIQLLAAYEPPSEQTAAAATAQYRWDLERRYPLCATCKQYVDQRLASISARLKTRRLAPAARMAGPAKFSQLQAIREETRARRGASRRNPWLSAVYPLLALLFDSLMMARRVAPSLWNYLYNSRPESLLLHRVLRTMNPNKQMPVLIAAFALPSILSGFKRGMWPAFLSIVLALLRVTLFLREQTLTTEKEWTMMALVVLIDISAVLGCIPVKPTVKQSANLVPVRDVEKKISAPKSDNPVVVPKIPMSSMEPSHSPSKTIVHDLMGLDFGLDSSAPIPSVKPVQATPFSFPYSFARQDRKPVLPPSRLDADKALSAMVGTPTALKGLHTGPSVPCLRPAVLLPPEQPSGLEGFMGGVSLKEDRKTRRPASVPSIPLPSLPSIPELIDAIPPLGLYGQLTLSVVFGCLRMAARDRLLPLTLILIASSSVRGPVWALLSSSQRMAFVAITVARFACVAAQLSEPDFARITLGSLAFRLLFLFIDLALLAAR